MGNVFYLCDREACVDCTSQCKHTGSIEHAVNFEKVGDTYFEKGGFWHDFWNGIRGIKSRK